MSTSHTEIAWTDRTWNVVRGCSRVSPGCGGPGRTGGCYAERQAHRFNYPGGPYEGLTRMTVNGPRWTGAVRLVPRLLDDPLRRRTPQRIFVNSMSDLFHEALPDEAIDQVFSVMLSAPRHTFQVLTKRPERMQRYMEASYVPAGVLVAGRERLLSSLEGDPQTWPPRNVWLGVSVEGQDQLRRIDRLKDTRSAVRFVSFEPLLEDLGALVLDGIQWAIFGGESGPGARPCDLGWIRSGVRQCQAQGVAAFVKQLGARPLYMPSDLSDAQFRDLDGSDHGYDHGPVILPPRDRKGGDPSEWPEDLRVREFPQAVKERPTP